MTNKKRQSSKKQSKDKSADVASQLEQAFLAGLGALANAQKAGGKAFDKLVEQGKSFRKDTTRKTESLLDEVQGAIRGMADDAQSKATGLVEHMRDTPQLEKLQSTFDARVASALQRIGVASKQSVDDLNSKIDRLLAAVEKKKRATKKRATKKTKATAKTAKSATAAPRKKTARKAVGKTSAGRTAAKRSRKKAVKKSVTKKST